MKGKKRKKPEREIKMSRVSGFERVAAHRIPKGAPEDILAWPGGEPILVLRPMAPVTALHCAVLALRHQDEKMLESAFEDGGRFMGFLAHRDGREVIVIEGEDPVPLEPGDIFTEVGAVYKAD